MEQRKEIENLEEDLNVLHRDELGVDDICNKITMSLFNKFTLYLVMMGAGSACVVIFSDKRTLYPLLGMMSMIFLMAVGLSTLMAFDKFKKIQPLVNEIKIRKVKLNKIVRDMQDQLNKVLIHISPSDSMSSDSVNFSLSRVTLMENTLRIESGSLKEDPISFLMLICGASLVYLLSIMTWIFFNE